MRPATAPKSTRPATGTATAAKPSTTTAAKRPTTSSTTSTAAARAGGAGARPATSSTARSNPTTALAPANANDATAGSAATTMTPAKRKLEIEKRLQELRSQRTVGTIDDNGAAATASAIASARSSMAQSEDGTFSGQSSLARMGSRREDSLADYATNGGDAFAATPSRSATSSVVAVANRGQSYTPLRHTTVDALPLVPPDDTWGTITVGSVLTIITDMKAIEESERTQLGFIGALSRAGGPATGGCMPEERKLLENMLERDPVRSLYAGEAGEVVALYTNFNVPEYEMKLFDGALMRFASGREQYFGRPCWSEFVMAKKEALKAAGANTAATTIRAVALAAASGGDGSVTGTALEGGGEASLNLGGLKEESKADMIARRTQELEQREKARQKRLQDTKQQTASTFSNLDGLSFNRNNTAASAAPPTPPSAASSTYNGPVIGSSAAPSTNGPTSSPAAAAHYAAASAAGNAANAGLSFGRLAKRQSDDVSGAVGTTGDGGAAAAAMHAHHHQQSSAAPSFRAAKQAVADHDNSSRTSSVSSVVSTVEPPAKTTTTAAMSPQRQPASKGVRGKAAPSSTAPAKDTKSSKIPPGAVPSSVAPLPLQKQ